MPVDAQLATEQCAWTKARQREYMKGYREANKEKIREHKAALYALQKVEKNIGDKRGPKPKILTAVETAQKLAEKKAAKAEYDKAYRKANSERLKLAKQAWGNTAVKKEYDRKWASENKPRVSEIKASYRQRNRDKAAEYYLATRDVRAQRARAYYLKNSEALKSKTKAWREANPQKASALAGKRAQAVRRATPPWADQAAMKEIYIYARGHGLEVDHIVPLQGKLVSGLHVEGNLRAIPKIENRRKGAQHAN